MHKPFAGTLGINKILKMERHLTSGLSESLVATNDISFNPSINSWLLQPRPPFRRCTTGVYPNFPSPLGGAMRRASSTYRGSKKFNGNSGRSCQSLVMEPWTHGLVKISEHHGTITAFVGWKDWTVEKWLPWRQLIHPKGILNTYMAAFHIFPFLLVPSRQQPPSSPPCQRGRGRTVAD